MTRESLSIYLCPQNTLPTTAFPTQRLCKKNAICVCYL